MRENPFPDLASLGACQKPGFRVVLYIEFITRPSPLGPHERAPMTSLIYAPIDTLENFVLADRWMAQTGNYWQAVAPFETPEDWFEDRHQDFAPQLVRPISDIPTDGILIWRDLEEGVIEMPAAEAAARLRDIAAPIEAMARAMAELEDDDCFTIADTYRDTISEHAGVEEDCRFWIRLASAAWTASRPVPAAGVLG